MFAKKPMPQRLLTLTEYKVGDIIRYDNSVFKVVGFEGGKDGIPILRESKVLVQFD